MLLQTFLKDAGTSHYYLGRVRDLVGGYHVGTGSSDYEECDLSILSPLI
jgi:hypothetical protein